MALAREVLSVSVYFILSFLFVLRGGLAIDTACNGQARLEFYPGLEPYHQTGFQVSNPKTAWAADVSDKSEAFLTYGPYTNLVGDSPSRVDFTLLIDNNNADNIKVLTVDVNDAATQTVLVSKDIHRTDFGEAMQPMTFSLFFSNTRCSRNLEFRVFYHCCSYIEHIQTTYQVLDPGMFDSFWSLRSHFVEYANTTFPTPGIPATKTTNVGTYFVVRGNVWYVFYRQFSYTTVPSYCQSLGISRVVVQYSIDEGRNWNPTIYPVATPIPGTSSACYVLDGSAFYDEETNVWHYLGQCLSEGSSWDMCHYYLPGASPLSPSGFTPDPRNPVVRGGQLFSQICAGSGKHCTVGTVDEGTPDIVVKKNGFYYVTFHGYDYQTARSARGVAKTPDFVHWIVDGFDLPNDAIFTSTDCNPWHVGWAPGGCVGGGEGDILISGDYFYHLIEAPDVSLACLTTIGRQNWVLGLLRSPMWAPSGSWEQFAVNPVVVPWVKEGCGLQYHRLFDNGTHVFMAFWVGDWDRGVDTLKFFVMEAGYKQLPMVESPYTWGLPVKKGIEQDRWY